MPISNNMKRIFFMMLMCITVAMGMQAESTVYVFLKSMSSTDTHVAIDGKTICDLNGPIKRTIKPTANLIYPFHTLEACFRKIKVSGEGKIIIAATMDYKNCTNGNVTTYKGEYPLDIEDGETYYLQLTSKGLNDIQIKEPKEKDALKWINKWTELPSVAYPTR